MAAALCAVIGAPALGQDEINRPGHLNPGVPGHSVNQGQPKPPPTIVLKQTGVAIDRLSKDELQIWGLQNEVKALKQLVASQQTQLSNAQAQMSALNSKLSGTQSALNALQTKFANHAHVFVQDIVLTPNGPRTTYQLRSTSKPMQPDSSGTYTSKPNW